MRRHHKVATVHFEGEVLHLTIDGQTRTFNIR